MKLFSKIKLAIQGKRILKELGLRFSWGDLTRIATVTARTMKSIRVDQETANEVATIIDELVTTRTDITDKDRLLDLVRWEIYALTHNPRKRRRYIEEAKRQIGRFRF